MRMPREREVLRTAIRDWSANAVETQRKFAAINESAKSHGMTYGQYMALLYEAERHFPDFALLYNSGADFPEIAKAIGTPEAAVEIWWESEGQPARAAWRYGRLTPEMKARMSGGAKEGGAA